VQEIQAEINDFKKKIDNTTDLQLSYIIRQANCADEAEKKMFDETINKYQDTINKYLDILKLKEEELRLKE
jgi:hypothetical protein